MIRKHAIHIIGMLMIGLVLLSLACSSTPSNNNEPPPDDGNPTEISGVVFEDSNGDGMKGADEGGVAGVLLSNGITTVQTDQSGNYQIPKEGYFVFITTPADYTVSGSWYRNISGAQFTFGLKPAPEKDSSSFRFVHMTDIHLDSANVAAFEQAVDEIGAMSPAFVVTTGDLVNEGDKVTISKAQADQWFGAYKNTMADLGVPFYTAAGNHDMADLLSEQTKAGASKDAFRNHFGPTYYSFDWGDYHCIVLDSNDMKSGSQVYQVSTQQVNWLQKDLSFHQGDPLLVFSHAPTTSWENQDQILNLLKQHNTHMFCGHWHQDAVIDYTGSVHQQVTGALSGEWWFGPAPDGMPGGYRVVSVNGEQIDSLFKELNNGQIVEVTQPGPIVSGQVALAANVYSDQGDIQGVTYQVDGGDAVAMDVTARGLWSVASAAWDASALSGYHEITMTATDTTGSFQTTIEVKVSSTDEIPISELMTHFDTFRGHYITVSGNVTMAIIEGLAGIGNAGMNLNQNGDDLVLYAGECKSPTLPAVAVGDAVSVKVIPLQFSWSFITAEPTIDYEANYSMMKSYQTMVPEWQLLQEGDTVTAMRLMRLVSAVDLTVL